MAGKGVYEAAAAIEHLVPKVASRVRGRPGMSIKGGYKDIAKKALQNYLNDPLSDEDYDKRFSGAGWKQPSATLGFIPSFIMNALNTAIYGRDYMAEKIKRLKGGLSTSTRRSESCPLPPGVGRCLATTIQGPTTPSTNNSNTTLKPAKFKNVFNNRPAPPTLLPCNMILTTAAAVFAARSTAKTKKVQARRRPQGGQVG